MAAPALAVIHFTLDTKYVRKRQLEALTIVAPGERLGAGLPAPIG